jgi:NitT/TauT family transport system substrate-binding protein
MALTIRSRVFGFTLATMVFSAAVCVGSTLAPTATAFAQGPTVPVKFQLNFTAGGFNAGFALALQQGYYKREGLDVTIEKGQGSAITAELVAAGKANIAYADALAVMQLIAKGAPMKVVATIYQSNPNAVTVLASSPIKTIQDLKGHSVGTPSGQSQTAMIPILFKANGLSASDVKLVSMPGSAMVATLLQHQVPAGGRDPRLRLRGLRRGHREHLGHRIQRLPCPAQRRGLEIHQGKPGGVERRDQAPGGRH